MAFKRPEKLIYLGTEGPRKGDYFQNVPARDLEEKDLAKLSDERIAEIMTPHPKLGPLYREPEARKKTDERAVTDAVS